MSSSPLRNAVSAWPRGNVARDARRAPGQVANATQLALRLFVDGAKPASAPKVALQWKVNDQCRHRPYCAFSGKRWAADAGTRNRWRNTVQYGRHRAGYSRVIS